MINELIKNKEVDGIVTIDSREVAEMMGRSHSDIMKMIQGSGKNLGIIPVLEKGNLIVSNYFIPSTYRVERNNKIYRCYLVTKMGCEVLGSKLQGEKGILFKSRFISKFKEMNTKELIHTTTKDFKYIQRDEILFIDLLEETLSVYNLSGIRQYNCCNNSYRIDYYIPELNIAIEYDEDDHKNYTYEQHEGRQKEIEQELGCKFIRVSDRYSHGYNVGYVIKELFNISV